jgi:hypothetical protein
MRHRAATNAADDLLKTALKQARNAGSAENVINGNQGKSRPRSSVRSIRLGKYSVNYVDLSINLCKNPFFSGHCLPLMVSFIP